MQIRWDFSKQAVWFKSVNSLAHSSSFRGICSGLTLMLGVVATLGSHWHISYSVDVVYWPHTIWGFFHFILDWNVWSVYCCSPSNGPGPVMLEKRSFWAAKSNTLLQPDCLTAQMCLPTTAASPAQLCWWREAWWCSSVSMSYVEAQNCTFQ